MADGEIKILFRTEADLKGAVDMNKAVAAMRDQLSHLPDNLKKVEEQSKATNATTEKLAKSKHGLKDAAKGLAFEFPLLGKALSLLANPITATIGLAVAAIGAFQRWTKSIDEAMESAQALARFKEGMDGASTSAAKLKATLTEYAAEAERAGKATDPILEQLDRQIEKTEKLLALRRELMGIQKEVGATTDKDAEQPGRDAWNQRMNAMIQAENQYRAQATAAEKALPGAAQARMTAGDNLSVAEKARELAGEELKAAQARRAAGAATGLGPNGRETPELATAVKEAQAKYDQAGVIAEARRREFSSAESSEKELQAARVQGISGAATVGKRRAKFIEDEAQAYPVRTNIEEIRTSQLGSQELQRIGSSIQQASGAFPILIDVLGSFGAVIKDVAAELPRLKAEYQQLKSQMEDRR